jgi:hypothetical protein
MNFQVGRLMIQVTSKGRHETPTFSVSRCIEILKMTVSRTIKEVRPQGHPCFMGFKGNNEISC